MVHQWKIFITTVRVLTLCVFLREGTTLKSGPLADGSRLSKTFRTRSNPSLGSEYRSYLEELRQKNKPLSKNDDSSEDGVNLFGGKAGVHVPSNSPVQSSKRYAGTKGAEDYQAPGRVVQSKRTFMQNPKSDPRSTSSEAFYRPNPRMINRHNAMIHQLLGKKANANPNPYPKQGFGSIHSFLPPPRNHESNTFSTRDSISVPSLSSKIDHLTTQSPKPSIHRGSSSPTLISTSPSATVVTTAVERLDPEVIARLEANPNTVTTQKTPVDMKPDQEMMAKIESNLQSYHDANENSQSWNPAEDVVHEPDVASFVRALQRQPHDLLRQALSHVSMERRKYPRHKTPVSVDHVTIKEYEPIKSPPDSALADNGDGEEILQTQPSGSENIASSAGRSNIPEKKKNADKPAEVIPSSPGNRGATRTMNVNVGGIQNGRPNIPLFQARPTGNKQKAWPRRQNRYQEADEVENNPSFNRKNFGMFGLPVYDGPLADSEHLGENELEMPLDDPSNVQKVGSFDADADSKPRHKNDIITALKAISQEFKDTGDSVWRTHSRSGETNNRIIVPKPSLENEPRTNDTHDRGFQERLRLEMVYVMEIINFFWVYIRNLFQKTFHITENSPRPTKGSDIQTNVAIEDHTTDSKFFDLVVGNKIKENVNSALDGDLMAKQSKEKVSSKKSFSEALENLQQSLSGVIVGEKVEEEALQNIIRNVAYKLKKHKIKGSGHVTRNNSFVNNMIEKDIGVAKNIQMPTAKNDAHDDSGQSAFTILKTKDIFPTPHELTELKKDVPTPGHDEQGKGTLQSKASNSKSAKLNFPSGILSRIPNSMNGSTTNQNKGGRKPYSILPYDVKLHSKGFHGMLTDFFQDSHRKHRTTGSRSFNALPDIASKKANTSAIKSKNQWNMSKEIPKRIHRQTSLHESRKKRDVARVKIIVLRRPRHGTKTPPVNKLDPDVGHREREVSTNKGTFLPKRKMQKGESNPIPQGRAYVPLESFGNSWYSNEDIQFSPEPLNRRVDNRGRIHNFQHRQTGFRKFHKEAPNKKIAPMIRIHAESEILRGVDTPFENNPTWLRSFWKQSGFAYPQMAFQKHSPSNFQRSNNGNNGQWNNNMQRPHPQPKASRRFWQEERYPSLGQHWGTPHQQPQLRVPENLDLGAICPWCGGKPGYVANQSPSSATNPQNAQPIPAPLAAPVAAPVAVPVAAPVAVPAAAPVAVPAATTVAAPPPAPPLATEAPSLDGSSATATSGGGVTGASNAGSAQKTRTTESPQQNVPTTMKTTSTNTPATTTRVKGIVRTTKSAQVTTNAPVATHVSTTTTLSLRSTVSPTSFTVAPSRSTVGPTSTTPTTLPLITTLSTRSTTQKPNKKIRVTKIKKCKYAEFICRINVFFSKGLDSSSSTEEYTIYHDSGEDHEHKETVSSNKCKSSRFGCGLRGQMVIGGNKGHSSWVTTMPPLYFTTKAPKPDQGGLEHRTREELISSIKNLAAQKSEGFLPFQRFLRLYRKRKMHKKPFDLPPLQKEFKIGFSRRSHSHGRFWQVGASKNKPSDSSHIGDDVYKLASPLPITTTQQATFERNNVYAHNAFARHLGKFVSTTENTVRSKW